MNHHTTTLSKEAIEAVNDLIEIVKDGQKGFQTAAKDVKAPELAAMFQRYAQQRTEFLGELQAHVASLGGEVQKSGTIAGKAHRGWIDLKSALSTNEPHAVLAEAERGEDAAVEAYREALERDDLDAATRELVSRQFAGVKAAHDEVRSLRDSERYRKA